MIFDTYQPIQLNNDFAPRLIVVVDTEEEFDWSSDPSPRNNATTAMDSLFRVQEIFDEYSIVPCYVIDYPIATQENSVDILREILKDGRCELGAHLHPWVNPPFGEELTRSNMYPGNLVEGLEHKKLNELAEQILMSFGVKARAYKAGRYGLGSNSLRIIKSLGFDIDLSVCTGFDYRADGGPDFSDFPATPSWLDDQRSMLEIPLSGAFVGPLGKFSKHFYNVAGYLHFLKARGILSRLGLVDRLMLSPEGYETEEHVKLSRFLFDQGVRTFTWNFHSPTVVPGMTMYTQTEKDVQHFLDKFRRFFDFFFNEMKGVASTPTLLKAELENIK